MNFFQIFTSHKTCGLVLSVATKKREEIDQPLVAGAPLRNTAKRTGTSVTALFRHKKDHLPATLAVAKQAKLENQADTLYSRLRLVNQQTATILIADAFEMTISQLMATPLITCDRRNRCSLRVPEKFLKPASKGPVLSSEA